MIPVSVVHTGRVPTDDAEDRLAAVRQDLERATARLRLLSDASTALSSVLDADEALNRLARLIVPQVADACVVDLVVDGGVRRLTVVQRDPARELPQPPESLPGPTTSTHRWRGCSVVPERWR